MNIHIGNLAREVTAEDLREVFAPFGEIVAINIIKDKYSGESRGFAFVEMANKAEGDAALAGLKGHILKERTMDVSEARPRNDKGGGWGGRGGRGGYGRGGGHRR